jgi:hypothetical protein
MQMVHDLLDAYGAIVVEINAYVYCSFAKHFEFIGVITVLSTVVHVTVQVNGAMEISVPFEYRVMKEDELCFFIIQNMIILDPFKIAPVELRIVNKSVVITPDQVLPAI